MNSKKNGFIKILLVIIAVIAVALFVYIRMGYRTETMPNNITDNKASSSLQNISSESNVISSDSENVKEQAGIIKNIKTTSDGWLLTIDYVSRNPSWLPGGNEKFFLNTDDKLRTLLISNKLTNNNTKFFECGSDNERYGAVIEAKIEDFVTQVKKELLANEPRYYFDIKDGKIDAIYTQCLP